MTAQFIALADGTKVEVPPDPRVLYAMLAKLPRLPQKPPPPPGSDEANMQRDVLRAARTARGEGDLKTEMLRSKSGYPLIGASFEGLVYANLSLDGFDLIDATFDDAKLMGDTSFVGARLDGASFVNTEMAGADLTGASFKSVILSGTDMRGVQFKGSIVEGTTFHNVDLSGADMRGLTSTIRLAGCTLDEIKVDDSFVDQINVDELAPFVNIARAVAAGSGHDFAVATFRRALRKIWIDAAVSGEDLLLESPLDVAHAAIATASKLNEAK